jgi:hypothetical protein
MAKGVTICGQMTVNSARSGPASDAPTPRKASRGTQEVPAPSIRHRCLTLLVPQIGKMAGPCANSPICCGANRVPIPVKNCDRPFTCPRTTLARTSGPDCETPELIVDLLRKR